MILAEANYETALQIASDRRSGNKQRGVRSLNRPFNLRKSTRHEFGMWIGYIEFDRHRPSFEVDLVRDSCDRRMKRSSRKRWDCKTDHRAFGNARRIVFGYWDDEPMPGGGFDPDDRFHCRRPAGWPHQSSGMHISSGNLTVERRSDVQIGFQLRDGFEVFLSGVG